MEKELKEELHILPDFLDGMPQEVIHTYRKWLLITKKIDGHKDRYYTVIHPKTGDSKVFDLKGNCGVIKKGILRFGGSKEDAEEAYRIASDLQQLKLEKARLNRDWTSHIYSKNKGEKSILSLRGPELIELFGKFFTINEIQQIVLDKWGFSIEQPYLKKFYVDNKDKIDKKRAAYILEGKELRLATDTGRLQLLSNMAFELERKFEKSKELNVSKELRAIVEQIRKEVKGEEIRLTVDGRIDIQATIQANQTLDEALKKLPINMIVIGMVAAKQGINPASVMALLGSSYYSRYNGFSKLHDHNAVELPGKYIKTFDWDNINSLSDSDVIDVEPISIMNEIPETKVPVVENTRMKMLEMLEQLKGKKYE
jgi:hypothetical protein